jgi:hypothetical protein
MGHPVCVLHVVFTEQDPLLVREVRKLYCHKKVFRIEEASLFWLLVVITNETEEGSIVGSRRALAPSSSSASHNFICNRVAGPGTSTGL